MSARLGSAPAMSQLVSGASTSGRALGGSGQLVLLVSSSRRPPTVAADSIAYPLPYDHVWEERHSYPNLNYARPSPYPNPNPNTNLTIARKKGILRSENAERDFRH